MIFYTDEDIKNMTISDLLDEAGRMSGHNESIIDPCVRDIIQLLILAVERMHLSRK